MGDTDDDDAVVLEIGDELDLHTFRADEVASLVPDYLAEAVHRGLADVRIIHGKGRGTLRRIVHAALERSPLVASYESADRAGGGWGATRVRLKPGGGPGDGTGT